jgi:hypothetical protein
MSTTHEPTRIDELPFFGHVVARLQIRRGSTLATGKQHVTIELDASGLNARQIGTLRNATVACPACGSRVHPFRARRGRTPERAAESVGRMFVSVACRYADSSGCARGKGASTEVQRIVAATEQRQQQLREPPCRPSPPKSAPSEPAQLPLLRGLL